MKKIALIISLVSLLSACATVQKPTHSNNTATNASLTEAASSVSRSLVQLAEIQESAHPITQLSQGPSPASYGMGADVSIDWSGPIEPLIKQIAMVTHYRVRILGSLPSVPIVITLSESNVPIADALRDAAYQCGKRANIVVYPETKVIEIRYAQN